MARQTIENLESAATVRSKLNSNFSDLYSNKADKSHASEGGDYGVATNNLYGHIKVATGNGLVLTNGALSLNTSSTSQAGAVQLVDNLTSNYTNRALTAAQGKILNDSINNLSDNSSPKNHASSETTYGVATNSLYGHVKVTTGNGLTLNNGTVAVNAASTSQYGTVQLNDTLTSTSTSQALTAAQGKYLYDEKAKAYSGSSAPSSALGKDGDIYFLIS